MTGTVSALPPSFASGRAAAFDDNFAPCFVVTIDTEEDFDWSAPFSRDQYKLDSVPALAECQRFFAASDVAPAYLIDWPIVQDGTAVSILAEAVAGGGASVGVQLHPWVNPPFDEVVNAHNSFAGNLPEQLERAKLTLLHDAISARIGIKPSVYRAGRYGFGPNTQKILLGLGFRCDTSVRSAFDYRAEGGPDYRAHPLHPWWLNSEATLLELPLTTVFCGHLRRASDQIFHRCAHMSPVATAALARLGLLERIALTPEGIPADKACMAIDEALAIGLPVLNFSFHSPSLMSGNTPYVRDATQLADFYRWWDVVLNHLARRGVRATSIDAIVAAAR